MSDYYHSMKDMRKLLEKAKEFCGVNMVPCKYLFKDKSKEFYADILDSKDGLLKPTLKDRTGDPKGPINGKLKGTTFTASWGSQDEWEIPAIPHGSSRLRINSDYLIRPCKYKLYFADFYCVGTEYHYVLLVLAEIDSRDNHFCESCLPLIEWDDNNLLTSFDKTTLKVVSREHCVVEVFLPNRIDVSKLIKSKKAFLDHFSPETEKRKYSVRAGFVKNALCQICNVEGQQQRFKFNPNILSCHVESRELVALNPISSTDDTLDKSIILNSTSDGSILSDGTSDKSIESGSATHGSDVPDKAPFGSDMPDSTTGELITPDGTTGELITPDCTTGELVLPDSTTDELIVPDSTSDESLDSDVISHGSSTQNNASNGAVKDDNKKRLHISMLSDDCDNRSSENDLSPVEERVIDRLEVASSCTLL